MAFTPDSQYFATGSWDQTVKLWDVNQRRIVRQFLGHRGPTVGIEFDPDDNILYTASGDYEDSGTVRIWNWNIAEHAVITKQLHDNQIRDVAISSDKTNPVIATGGSEGDIQLWWPHRKKNQALLVPKQTKYPVNCLAFHPKKTNILITGHNDGRIQEWDITTGKVVHTYVKEKGDVLSLCYSPEGDRLVVGLGDRLDGTKKGTIRIWDTNKRKLLYSDLSDTSSVFSVTVSNSGKYIVSGSGVYDEPDRRYVKGTLKLWNLKTGQFINDLPCKQQHKVECVRYNPQGTMLASASSDHSIHLLPLEKGKKPIPLIGHTDDVYDLTFCPDGKRLASASLDYSVKIWDVAKAEVVFTLTTVDECRSLSFSSDGRYLVVALGNGQLNLYDCGEE